MESKSQDLIRIDVWLVDQGYAPSRSKAQELIDESRVEIFKDSKWQILSQASLRIAKTFSTDLIRVDSEEVLRFVSRAGRKLEGALHDFEIGVAGIVALDLGQSTGGFTDCLLQKGAHRVVGIDVGRDQLSPRLQENVRVTAIEEINLKDLRTDTRFQQAVPPEGFALTVCDLSFISSLQHLDDVLGWSDAVVLLVKPQFELGAAVLNKKGLVQRPELISDLKLQFEKECKLRGYSECRWAPSHLSGRDGNQEYFLYAKRNQ